MVMARSSKSLHNKRRTNRSSITMPPPPSPPPHSQTSSFPGSLQTKIPVFASLVMILAVVFLLGISSITWRNPVASSVVHNQPPAPVRLYSVQAVNQFPHDPQAFTQGLVYAGHGRLFESTGLYGRSSVRRVELQTGKVDLLEKMDKSYFGEGLTLFGERLFQVTWLTKTGFTYDRNNLSKIGKFTHQMQDGWGLATDGKILFGSDGTSTLYQLDPQTLKVIKSHTVKYNDHEIRYLNELEFVKGEVWANVWQTDCIARISPKDGALLGWILLPNLRKELIEAGHNGIDVLNGIAWDYKDDRIFVTGKLWPKLYEIKLHPVKKHDNEIIERLCIPRT